MKFIIEHLDKDLHEWSIIEYRRGAELIGKENFLVTNLDEKYHEKLSGWMQVTQKSIQDMPELHNDRTCVLDPNGDENLRSQDRKKFDVMVFGGILGDDPPSPRTKDELKVNGAIRKQLGKDQLPTDNAILVTAEILNGKKFEELKLQKDLEIQLDEGESIVLPFAYRIIDDTPYISEKIIRILQEDEGF